MSDFAARIGELRLSELKLLIELSQTPSLRGLARRLGIHPSLVSKVVRKVEARVGYPLVTRSTSGMRFTIEGMHFLKTAKRIVDLSAGLRSGPATSAGEEPLRAVYGLAAQSFIHQFLIPECLASLPKRGLDLRFRLLEVPGKDLIVSGINGLFEIAIHLGKMDWPRSWESKKLGNFRSKLYGRAGHPLGAKATEARVKAYSFVTPARWTKNGAQAGDDLCPLSVDERRTGDAVATAGTALEIVRRTDQLSFLPEVVAIDFVRRGELREIRVDEWPDVQEALYLSVRAEVVPQKLLAHFQAELPRLLKF